MKQRSQKRKTQGVHSLRRIPQQRGWGETPVDRWDTTKCEIGWSGEA